MKYLYEKDIGQLVQELRKQKGSLEFGLGWSSNECMWLVTESLDYCIEGETLIIGRGISIQEALRRAIEHYQKETE